MLSGLKLLLVDDDDDLRYVVSRRLRQLGAEVRDYGRLERLQTEMHDWLPHVAVIDAHLPDGDGAALGVSLLAGLPELKLILLTGDASALATYASTPGRIWHLLKPVSLEQLQRTILAAHHSPLPRAGSSLRAQPALVS
jgi:two-component system response regulator AtoC